MSDSSVWHPFVQHKLDAPFEKIVFTEGAYLYTKSGQKIFDAISSWWVITHQHRHPLIQQAIIDACGKLDQVIFAEFSHNAAEELAKNLLELAPAGLEYVFYSDSGSTAVEVALKMALGAFYNRGQTEKQEIIVMEHSYHGDTIGTMAAGAPGVFNAPFHPLLYQVKRLPFPAQGQEQHCIDSLIEFCKSGKVAALLLEPLILGAGGMQIYSPNILKQLYDIAKAYNVFVIADEVMTGWGRTGSRFACDQANITPDILCTSKGITGGSLPLAATLATAELFAAHYSDERSKSFYHSSSYTANPIACAAALANTKIWKTEPVLTRIEQLTISQTKQLERLSKHVAVQDCRQLGTIAAANLASSTTGYLAQIGPKLKKLCRQQGLLVRPLGNVLYIMPPFCSTHKELEHIYDIILNSLDELKL